MSRAYRTRKQQLTTDPAATFNFAQTVLSKVRKHRKAQLVAGEIGQAAHDADVAAARALVRLAEHAMLARTPFN